MLTKKMTTAVASCLGVAALVFPLAGATSAQSAPAGSLAPPKIDIAGAVGEKNSSDPNLLENQDNEYNYVSFGDSMASDPTVADIRAERAIDRGVNMTWPTIQSEGVDGKCAQGPNNYARQVAKNTGLRLDDYSCSGLTAYSPSNPLVPGKRTQIKHYVNKAVDDGALNDKTELVTVLVGFNEFYSKDTWTMTDEQRAQAFHDEIVPSLNKIREHAPNAQIQMLGYPDETDGRNNTCGSNLLGMTTTWYFPPIAFFQDRMRDYQRDAAAAASDGQTDPNEARDGGVTFIDMMDEINVTRGNSGCQQDGPRLNSTIFDDSPHRLSVHLTSNGHEYYAARIAEEYDNAKTGADFGTSEWISPHLPDFDPNAPMNRLTAPLPWKPEIPR